MFISPNWVWIGLFIWLGVINPGFWILGIALEAGYLLRMATNPRFQRYVEGTLLQKEQDNWTDKVKKLTDKLLPPLNEQYQRLYNRCSQIIEGQHLEQNNATVDIQRQGLAKMLWIYLKLLLTKQSLLQLIREIDKDNTYQRGTTLVANQIDQITKKLKSTNLNDITRKSLQSTLDILNQRLQSRSQADEKISYVDAELGRIEQQLELIREQAILAADPGLISDRIDQVSTSLGDTSKWVMEQQQIFGAIEDTTAPPMFSSTEGKEQA
jgi:hypothetical protein